MSSLLNTSSVSNSVENSTAAPAIGVAQRPQQVENLFHLTPAQCESLAGCFEQFGQILHKDSTKLVIQHDQLVLKEIVVPTQPVVATVATQQPQQSVSHANEATNTASSTTQARHVVATNADYPSIMAGVMIEEQQQQLVYMATVQKYKQECRALSNEYNFALYLQKYDKYQSNVVNNSDGSGDFSTIPPNFSSVDRYLAPAIKFGTSPNRAVLLSYFFDQKDSWRHLIDRYQGLFNGISNPMNQLCHQAVRHILFGSMKVASQIATGLNFLHNQLNVAHNDIKPDNFFAHEGAHPNLPTTASAINSYSNDDDRVHYFLGDFGFAKRAGFADAREATAQFEMKARTYLSPEILDLISRMTTNMSYEDCQNLEKRGDVFALGVSLFQILFHANPFKVECSRQDQLFSLLAFNPQKFWSYFQKQLNVYGTIIDINLLKDFLTSMLHQDPNQRFNINQVLNHPWLSQINHYLFSQ